MTDLLKYYNIDVGTSWMLNQHPFHSKHFVVLYLTNIGEVYLCITRLYWVDFDRKTGMRSVCYGKYSIIPDSRFGFTYLRGFDWSTTTRNSRAVLLYLHDVRVCLLLVVVCVSSRFIFCQYWYALLSLFFFFNVHKTIGPHKFNASRQEPHSR
jgi:hypothetical protein